MCIYGSHRRQANDPPVAASPSGFPFSHKAFWISEWSRLGNRKLIETLGKIFFFCNRAMRFISQVPCHLFNFPMILLLREIRKRARLKSEPYERYGNRRFIKQKASIHAFSNFSFRRMKHVLRNTEMLSTTRSARELVYERAGLASGWFVFRTDVPRCIGVLSRCC